MTLGPFGRFWEERVYVVHDWAEVHRLFDREGLSKSRIAERLGMSRNTVARLLGLDEPPRYQRKPRGSKLDPCKGSIGVMLERDPRVGGEGGLGAVVSGGLRRWDQHPVGLPDPCASPEGKPEGVSADQLFACGGWRSATGGSCRDRFRWVGASPGRCMGW